MKILVPTDFSENANHAIEYASVVAKATSAELLLLYVYSPPVTRFNLSYPLITDEIGRAKKEANEQLSTNCLEICDVYGVVCKSLVKTGNPVEEIVGEAKDAEMDLIIMGTEGASGIDRVLFGSNTAAVIERASCPVVAVPAQTKLFIPRRIVFATDYHANDMQSMKAVTVLASQFKAEVLIVHVTKEKMKSDLDLIEQFSKAVARDTGIKEPFYYVMTHDDVQKGIDLFVDAVGADLIALSTRKRNFFEKLFDKSLTKKMAYQAQLPLMVFHSEVEERPDNEDF